MDNIIIQNVSEDTITIAVDGQLQEIQNRLDALQALLEKQEVQSFQTGDKIYNIGSITNANFGFVVGQTGHKKKLPESVAEDIITDDNRWVESIKQELKIRQRVSVGNNPTAIFQHYGWLIEEFLRKMETPAGRERSLRRLSFMVEVFQGSLRYLCYIQIAQLLKRRGVSNHPLLSDFLTLEENQYQTFDYLNLMLIATELLPKENAFMPQINDFVAELTNTKSELYGTTLFMDKYRNLLLENLIAEGNQLDQLLDEYLTGLVFWLRKISFLAKYRLVSIKDINLQYRLGTAKNFVHLYGELHGVYNRAYMDEEDYGEKAIEGLFTFNQSVLLFDGNNAETCLENIHDDTTYISLSPLIIDHSVFSDKPTDTPEIYYFTGYQSRKYHFAQYKNELPFGMLKEIPSNKTIHIKVTNIKQPKFDELFQQMEQVFDAFKNVGE